MELKKVKETINKSTNSYGRDKRPKTWDRKTKTDENNDNWKLEETETEKKTAKQWTQWTQLT